MDSSFIKAFNLSMTYEVGPRFNPEDPKVIDGSDLKKCGYVNDPKDKGGETKWGISTKSYPNLNIKSLTLADAQQIYYNDYWKKTMCDKMPIAVAMVHFDACINNGSSRAVKFLQQSCNAGEDGLIGPGTLSKVQESCAADGHKAVVEKMLSNREAFFKKIVDKDPTQSVFLKGWLNRIDNLRKLALG